LGLGVNYTGFYGFTLSRQLASLGVTGVGFDNSFDLAAQAGFDVDLKTTRS
jgi:outer membrane protein W